MKIRIGTRGSLLARWQADTTSRLLRELSRDIEVEITIIRTEGDDNQAVALSQLPGKAFFTKEIEDALLRKEIDLAVHSGKDVPTELPEELALAGFLKRQSPTDALISRTGGDLASLAPQTVVGTSSIRRHAFLAYLRPDLVIRDLRGNVDTRLRKVEEGQYDAIILATAGLERLGLTDRISARLGLPDFLPAVAQGAMALETRIEDKELVQLLSKIVDAETTMAVNAERELLHGLEGGCQVPLGALAEITGSEITLRAALVAPDGSRRIDARLSCSTADAKGLGKRLARQLIGQGGDQIIELVRR